MTRLGSLALLLALIAPAAAQVTPTSAPASAPAAGIKDIQRFFSPGTFAVVRIDTAKFDLEKAFKMLAPVFKGEEKDLAKMHDDAAAVFGKFTKAGGRVAFIVASTEDLEGPMPVFFVFPVAKGGDAKAMGNIVMYGSEKVPESAPVSPTRGPVAAVVSDFVIIGSQPVQARLKEMTPTPRPDIEKLFSTLGDAMAQAVFVPQPLTEKLAQALPPALPQELGGGQIKVFTDGVAAILIEADATPTLRVKLTVQSPSKEAATALKDGLATVVSSLKNIAKQDSWGTTPAGLLDLAELQQDGDKLSWALEGKQSEEVVQKTLLPMFAQARQDAKRAMSHSNLHFISIAVIMYGNDKNAFPPDLEALKAAKMIPEDARFLTNPRMPDKMPGYIYVAPSETPGKLEKAADRVLVYEAYDKWPEGGIAVGYADGHSAVVKNEADFLKQLKEAMDKAAKK